MPATPATPEVEIRRIVIQSQPRQKVSEIPISTKKLDMVLAPVIPGTWEA
jgi:hypothetical protein